MGRYCICPLNLLAETVSANKVKRQIPLFFQICVNFYVIWYWQIPSISMLSNLLVCNSSIISISNAISIITSSLLLMSPPTISYSSNIPITSIFITNPATFITSSFLSTSSTTSSCQTAAAALSSLEQLGAWNCYLPIVIGR